jgi:hypothetical protein
MKPQSNRLSKAHSTKGPTNLSGSFHSRQNGDLLVSNLMRKWRKFARQYGAGALGIYAVQCYDAWPVFYVRANSGEAALSRFAHTVAIAMRIRAASAAASMGTTTKPLYLTAQPIFLISAGRCTDRKCPCGGAPTFALRAI